MSSGLVDTILEYDTTADSFSQIGTMTEPRYHNGVTVVQYESFSKWCQ